jgi:hypothetical protein
MLELGDGRRRAGTGETKIGRGPQPFIGAGGRRRCWGLNGRCQCRALKTLVTQSAGGLDLRPS